MLTMFKEIKVRLEGFVGEIEAAERSGGRAFHAQRKASAKALRQEQLGMLEREVHGGRSRDPGGGWRRTSSERQAKAGSFGPVRIGFCSVSQWKSLDGSEH